MCHFILSTIPPNVDQEIILRTIKKYHRDYRPAEHNLSGEIIHKDDKLYYTTKGHCDCGTPLGTGNNSRSKGPSKRDLSKLRRKGWSEAKISRWVDQWMKNIKKDNRKLSEYDRSTTPEITEWKELVIDILSQKEIVRFGLVLVWSPKSKITIDSVKQISLDNLDIDVLRCMEENVLYEFTD